MYWCGLQLLELRNWYVIVMLFFLLEVGFFFYLYFLGCDFVEDLVVDDEFKVFIFMVIENK